MKILHTVQLYHPNVGGAQEVVRQVSERLAQRGHQVTVATARLPERASRQLNGVQIEEFEVQGNAVLGFQGEANRYQQFLQDGDFDVMMNYAAQQWATDLVFPVLKTLPYARILIPCGFSKLYFHRYAGYFEQIPQVLAGYDRLIFHASRYRDIDFARRNGFENFSIIPNGASEIEFEQTGIDFRQRYGIPEEVPLLLTVGSHTRAKGHQMAIESFRRARIGKAVLVVIGNRMGRRGCYPEDALLSRLANVASFGQKKVLLLDPSRAEVVAAYQAADLFIFGSNIEYSPLVLFEAMASHTPYLSTACGNAEEITEWSQGGKVLPTRQQPNGYGYGDPKDFAHAIEELVHNPEERSRLGEAGYQAWRQRFTWQQIAVEYERVYQQTIEERQEKEQSRGI